MERILNKIRENTVDQIIEIFWLAIKAAVVTAIILVLLQIIPVKVHTGVYQIDRRWDVSADVHQTGAWDVNADVDQVGTWTVSNL